MFDTLSSSLGRPSEDLHQRHQDKLFGIGGTALVRRHFNLDTPGPGSHRILPSHTQTTWDQFIGILRVRPPPSSVGPDLPRSAEISGRTPNIQRTWDARKILEVYGVEAARASVWETWK